MPRGSRVIAVGACAADGCKVSDTAEPVAVAEILDVAHTLPGCPHDPQELVNALVAMFEETGEGRRDADR
jgi:Ni,Fe-hydrogenase III small subunit